MTGLYGRYLRESFVLLGYVLKVTVNNRSVSEIQQGLTIHNYCFIKSFRSGRAFPGSLMQSYLMDEFLFNTLDMWSFSLSPTAAVMGSLLPHKAVHFSFAWF